MRVPYLGKALGGWTTKTNVMIITKTVSNFQGVQTPVSMVLDINYQPMPQTQVDRKPIEQRTWKWWTLIVKGVSTLLKVDDLVMIGSYGFRVQSARDWTTSGFSIFEAIQDFTPEPSS